MKNPKRQTPKPKEAPTPKKQSPIVYPNPTPQADGWIVRDEPASDGKRHPFDLEDRTASLAKQ
jgi:hypothetical protein